jgi:hypothetical protein
MIFNFVIITVVYLQKFLPEFWTVVATNRHLMLMHQWTLATLSMQNLGRKSLKQSGYARHDNFARYLRCLRKGRMWERRTTLWKILQRA